MISDLTKSVWGLFCAKHRTVLSLSLELISVSLSETLFNTIYKLCCRSVNSRVAAGFCRLDPGVLAHRQR